MADRCTGIHWTVRHAATSRVIFGSCAIHSMEGDTGGGSSGRWHTADRSVTVRYSDYCTLQRARGLPVSGSLSLFTRIWRRHEEIAQQKAKLHSICDYCGKLLA
eukprot:2161393-Pleurochrysis_carterae.AAC.1